MQVTIAVASLAEEEAGDEKRVAGGGVGGDLGSEKQIAGEWERQRVKEKSAGEGRERKRSS